MVGQNRERKNLILGWFTSTQDFNHRPGGHGIVQDVSLTMLIEEFFDTSSDVKRLLLVGQLFRIGVNSF